jgi:hypothetical protein
MSVHHNTWRRESHKIPSPRRFWTGSIAIGTCSLALMRNYHQVAYSAIRMAVTATAAMLNPALVE